MARTTFVAQRQNDHTGGRIAAGQSELFVLACVVFQHIKSKWLTATVSNYSIRETNGVD